MIGKAVIKLLEVPPITDVVEEKIFPVIAPQRVEGPFLIYGITSVENTDSKNESVMDIVSVEIHLFSSVYFQIQSLAFQVRAAIEKKRGLFEGIEVSDIVFVDYSDAYDEKYERYVGKLLFEFSCNANYAI